jgi:hypothetical protein
MPLSFQDAFVTLILISLFALPVVWFLPSLLSSLLDTLKSLFESLVLLVAGTTLVLTLLGIALIGEKAVRRWKGEAAATISPSGGPQTESLRQAARHDRDHLRQRADNKLDRAADKVIDRLEATSAGKLLRRKVKGSRADKGKGRAADEGVELSEIRRGAESASTGVRRMPPPPPPLPAR